jgi:Bax protein
MTALKSRYITLLFIVLLTGFTMPRASAQSVVIINGLDEAIAWLESENWWGEEKHDVQLQVPHAIVTGIPVTWQKNSQSLPVAQKKEIFYRFMLPLIMHANTMVLERREWLTAMRQKVTLDSALSAEELKWLGEAAVLLRISKQDALPGAETSSQDLLKIVDEAMYKLDIIPAGLALGQAAYESGYGTSRFAVTGNALFGQWTFGGKGLVPEQQRASLGDHRIAAFDWPFDSVRGYFLNLCSHPAYEDFRKLRAELRASGKPLTSTALADGLIKYSERGQEYVDTLKGIIRVNKLAIADNAVFRDEPISFVVPASSDEEAASLEERLAALRASGELDAIVARMRLE